MHIAFYINITGPTNEHKANRQQVFYDFHNISKQMQDNINKEGILALVTEANGNGGQIIFMCKRFNLLVVLTGGNYNRRDNFHGYWGAIDSVFAALQCGPEEFSFPCLHS